MVKFGKVLAASKQAKWRKHYFNYKALKDLLKPGPPDTRLSLTLLFFASMDEELNKVLAVVWPTAIDIKTSLAGLSAQLPAQIETLVQGRSLDSANEYARQVLVRAKETRELILFLDVNLMAIHKVMKKFTKKIQAKSAYDYLSAKCGSESARLWDFSVTSTQLLTSLLSDLEVISCKLVPRRTSKEAPLAEPLLRSAEEQLLENAESLQSLVAQLQVSLQTLQVCMPLARYLKRLPSREGHRKPLLTLSEALGVVILTAYWANCLTFYADLQESGVQWLAITPAVGILVSIFNGLTWEVDYKLPLLYAILFNAAGNALSHVPGQWFLLISR